MRLSLTEYGYSYPLQVKNSMHVGTRYLADLFQQFGDWKAVFRAYYAGPENGHNGNYDWYANAVAKRISDYRRVMEN